MKTFLLSFLGGVAALFMFFVLIPFAILMSVLPSSAPPTTRNAVLELDLRNSYPDQPAADGLGALFSSDVSFVQILLRLNAAADDPNIKGVYVRAAEFDMGSSRAEELREAFLRLKSSGKFVVAHSQGFFASGPAAYRAISAADEIWMQPGASFEAPGITFETMFLGNALGMLNVTPEIEQLFEYKNAADIYKRDSYTPAHEEAMTRLASSVWEHSVADIASDRGMDAPGMRALLEASPHQAEQALDMKLIDKLGWPEQAATSAKERAGGELVSISDYTPPRRRGKAVIAITGGEGDIVTGGSGATDIFSLGSPVFASDRVAAELFALAEDDSIHAVVFRVDSPGGSATASDQVWHAIEHLQESGKVVVVSMGSMAASGGYYVSAGADAIVAPRSTVTGSIGVFGGKFAIADGLRMIGVNPDLVRVGGEYSSTYSSEKLTPVQRQKLQASLDGVYQRFMQLVADGRGFDTDRVHELARGRIWSGEDAVANGLIDANGDLITAIEMARDLAGFSEEDGVQIRMRVQRTSPFDLISGFFTAAQVGAADPALIQALGAIPNDRHAVTILRQVMMMRQHGAQVWTPPIIER